MQTSINMKKMLLFTSLLLATLTAGARGLLIKTTSGVEAYYPITDTSRPVMQFVNQQVWVSGRHYQFGDIAEFRLVDADPTGISLPTENGLAEGHLVVATNETVTVSDLSGKLLRVPVVCGDNHQVVDLTRLFRGTYVVKAGKSSFKFVKK